MIALLGYGKTTLALAKKIKDVAFFDDDVQKPMKDKEGFLRYPSNHYHPDRFKLQIPSPGIPPSHPLIQKSTNLLSDYDYLYDDFPYSIWISGTNGKTTTTQMCQYLLQDRGAVSGGNIGIPLADLDPRKPIWILETSSFTLHYTSFAKPNLYILLPITPDHISWHGSFEAYEKAKLKPLERLKEAEVAIVPKKYLHYPSKGFKIGYENAEDLAAYFGIDPTRIKFRGPFLLDALLALATTKILFNEIDYERINSFKLDPHKQEEFHDKGGRLWVDDSKATNIDAAIEALKKYSDKRVYLILGGDHKGADLEPLFTTMHSNVEIFAIGKSMEHILQLAKKYNIPSHRCGTLDIAVAKIKKIHDKNSVALLSPACASLDQFKNYKERGELFKKEVLS